MGQLIVRDGDTGTHGGTVSAGQTVWKCEGIPIARKGDTYNCPTHGANPIMAGSAKWNCKGKPIARHGDATACGATLISGAKKWTA